MSDSRTSNVIKNSGASLLYRLVQVLLKFFIRTIFIHYLGNEYTGVSGLFTDILHVLSLMEMGLDTSMIYSLYKPVSQNDTKRINVLMSFYKKAFNTIGVVILLCGVICTPFLDYIVKDVPNISEDIRGIFLMYVATTSFSYFLIYKTVLLRANQKSRIISNWNSAVFIAETVLEAVLIIIFRRFYAYLIVHFLATVLRNIVLSRKTSRLYPEYLAKTDERLTPEEKRRLFRDLACLVVYNASGVIIYSTDSIFISAFLGTVEVAIIGNFTLIIDAIRKIIESIASVTKPSIGNLAATSDKAKQETVFLQMNFISFAAVCFSCTCLFVLLNPFVGSIWLNESYKLTIAPLSILVINFFIAVLVYPVESFRTANGLFVQGWMRPAVMAIMNIVLDFFMGKQWGLIGILLATTISRLSTQAWFDPYLIYKLVFKKSPKQYYARYLLYAAVTVISCALAYLLCTLPNTGNAYLDFIMKAFLAAVTPCVILFLLFRKTAEFQYVLSLFRRFKKKLLKRARH